MNKKNLDLLNKFATDQSLAKEIKVDITEYCKHFRPRLENSYAEYKEYNLLADMIRGAEHFIYFLERNNYKIVKNHGKKTLQKR